jgi:hypothetical protein
MRFNAFSWSKFAAWLATSLMSGYFLSCSVNPFSRLSAAEAQDWDGDRCDK